MVEAVKFHAENININPGFIYRSYKASWLVGLLIKRRDGSFKDHLIWMFASLSTDNDGDYKSEIMIDQYYFV